LGARRNLARTCRSSALAFVVGVGVLAGPGGGGRPALGQPSGVGSIEGRLVLPATPGARTAERYVSSTGESRDVPRIPLVVYLEGAVPSAAAARPSGPLELRQRGESFVPELLVVPVGARVGFPNGDPIFHNVFSYSRPKRFDLGRYRQGETKTVQFDRPGYVKVMCEVHKWMRAGILVVENPFYAIVPDSGRFRIDGIPAGRYRVAIEHFDRRPHSLEVVIREGATTPLDLKL
jgi:plastocyanin